MKRVVIVVVLLIGIVAGVYWLTENPGSICSSGGVAIKPAPAFTPQANPILIDKDVPLLEQINREYTQIAQAVLPSVVNISTKQKAENIRQGVPLPPEMMPFFGIPQNPRMRPKGRVPQQELSSLGSGILISREGHLITNAHVVKGAEVITVMLFDQRKFDAKIIGTDVMSDIAVLKIDAPEPLPALPWGDSDRLRVGEQVLAIGNPFGLAESVSAGIVSAKGRNPGLSQNGYEGFIQTDAAINPGNSGGALVNIHGELIGINVAILSAEGGFNGIGFAIPSNLAKFAMDGLVKSGKVVRGYLGVMIGSLKPDMMGFYGVDKEHGALVDEVTPDSPADKAGIQRGDLIIEIDGVKVQETAQFRIIVSQTPPGKEVKLVVLRNRQEKTITLKLGELPAELARSGDPEVIAEEHDSSQEAKTKNVLRGIKVQNLDKNLRAQLGVPLNVNGAVVVGIGEGCPAEASGLEEGDLIQELKTRTGMFEKVQDASSFVAFAKKLKANEDVMIYVRRGKASTFLVIRAK